MTCIIGLEHEGEVYIGADSAATTGWSIEPVVWPKVFQREAFLIGCTGSLRPAQILQYYLEVRPQHPDEPDEQYIARAFIDAVRTCLKAQGYATVDDNREKGSTFLVGYNGGAYHIGNDYGIVRSRDGFIATGCGDEYAMGAMAALADLDPIDRITQSLMISARFSAAVMGPFTVLKWQDEETAPE